MLALVRSLVPAFISLILLILGSAFFNTFLSIRLEMEGHSIETIGFVTASLYIGILAGAVFVSRIIAKIGHIRSFMVFLSSLVVLILLQAIWVNPWYWCVLRFLGGMSVAGVIIAFESWLLLVSPPQFRGAILSVYLAVLYASLSVGQLLLRISQPETNFPFYLTAAFCLLAMLPLLLVKNTTPNLEKSENVPYMRQFRAVPFGFLGGGVAGMLLAIVYSLVPVYGLEIGLTIEEVGTMMALLIFGGLCFQWPIGRFADKKNRKGVMTMACFSTAALAFGIPWTDQISSILFFAVVWLFGGFAFTIYPLSMGYICEKLDKNQIVAATGNFAFSYGIGAIAGPLLAPIAMKSIGAHGLFYFLGAITLTLGMIGWLQQEKKISV